MRRETLERAQRREARRERLRLGRDLARHALGDLVPALREIAAHAALELGREFGMSGPIALEARLPFGLRGLAARRRIPRGLDLVRDHERRVLPAERLARRRDLFRAERGAVRGGGALLVRRAPADRRLAADQRRALALGARRVDRGLDRFGIVPVDVLDDVPAVRAKAR